MTPQNLINSLKEFVENSIKDIILPVNDQDGEGLKPRAAKVHALSLPDKDSTLGAVPYVLLQLLKGKDEGEDFTCDIRMVICVYNPNEVDGNWQRLSLVTRIKTDLEKTVLIGKKYLLQMPVEYLLYDSDTAPYFVAEIMTTFSLPPVHREIKTNWKGDL